MKILFKCLPFVKKGESFLFVSRHPLLISEDGVVNILSNYQATKQRAENGQLYSMTATKTLFGLFFGIQFLVLHKIISRLGYTDKSGGAVSKFNRTHYYY